MQERKVSMYKKVIFKLKCVNRAIQIKRVAEALESLSEENTGRGSKKNVAMIVRTRSIYG